MDNNKIKAYKGFNKDMTCRGFQYEVGKEYEHNGEVEVCESGFHACENPFDVLNFYGDTIENRFCEVEQSGIIKSDNIKTASSKIKIKAEIGWAGLFKAGIEWLKEITDPRKIEVDNSSSSGDAAKIGSSGDAAKIGSSGDAAQIGSSGDAAKIGSSGYAAQIDSTGKDSVICCAGHDCKVKAKVGSWITLAEWKLDYQKRCLVPKCVKTEFVDGENIKADTWYKLVDGKFVECDD